MDIRFGHRRGESPESANRKCSMLQSKSMSMIEYDWGRRAFFPPCSLVCHSMYSGSCRMGVRFVARPSTVGGRSAMASKALTDQVAAKWQDLFNRLNRGAPGISGLMGFSRVRDLPSHPPPPGHVTQLWGFDVQLGDLASCPSFLSRPGRLLQMFCTPESLERLRRTLVSLVCALCAGCF